VRIGELRSGIHRLRIVVRLGGRRIVVRRRVRVC
jgi:hypothetical protein